MILFSDTPNLYSSLKVRDRASQAYSTTDNIIVKIVPYIKGGIQAKGIWKQELCCMVVKHSPLH